MTIDEAKKFIVWARHNGVTQCRFGELEFLVDPADDPKGQHITDEELTYWSANNGISS